MDKKSKTSVMKAISDTDKCQFYDPGMQFDSAMWLYLVSFLGTASVIPGNVVTALFMQKFGRVNLLSGSLIVSGISALMFFFVTQSESGLLMMLCFFNCVTIAAWCSILVLVCEAYGTEKRTTGLAAVCAVSKVAAIFSSVIYPVMVGGTSGSGASVALVTCLVAAAGGVFAQRVKDTHDEPLY